MHPIFAARQTVHLFNDAPVDEEAVKRALQAAQLAPCHKFTWPWRFVRAGRATRERLYTVNVALKFPAGAPERVLPKLTQKLLNPQLLVVSQVRSANPVTAKEDYAAVASAIQNFCLSLANDGIGSKWSSGGVLNDPRTAAILGIDPAEQEIVAFVFFGHAAEQRPRPERPPLESLLRVLP